MGWTLNFGNKKTWYWTAGFFVALASSYVYCIKTGKKSHYSFEEVKSMFMNTFKK